MSTLFVVWLATSGVFGFSAQDSVDMACPIAIKHRGQVFQVKDPGVRYAVTCTAPGCDFPGWVVVPVECRPLKEHQVIVPATWTIMSSSTTAVQP